MDAKRVLVTGAGVGIGKAIALELAKQGFAMVLHCNKHRANAEAVAQEIIASGGSASVISCDITDAQSVLTTLTQDMEQHGAYWGVVANAGVNDDNAFPAMSAEQWHRVIDTNLNGFYNVVNPLIMPMIRLRQGGRIVAITSVSGVVGNRGQANYAASKAGIIGACKSIAIELAKRNITVNCVAPGIIATEMVNNDIIEHALPLVPMGRVGQVTDVAKTVVFLFSEGAGYITRQVINVNGGMC